MTDFDNSFLTDGGSEAQHEDALVFELNGMKVGWKPSGLALKRASAQGVEAGEILETLQGDADAEAIQSILKDADKDSLDELEEEDLSEEQMEALGELLGGGLSSQIEMIATLVWIGTLHFEPNAKRDVILSILDPASIEDLPVDTMFERIFPALSEVEVESEGK